MDGRDVTNKSRKALQNIPGTHSTTKRMQIVLDALSQIFCFKRLGSIASGLLFTIRSPTLSGVFKDSPNSQILDMHHTNPTLERQRISNYGASVRTSGEEI